MPKLADCLRVRLDSQTQAKRLQAYEEDAARGLAEVCASSLVNMDTLKEAARLAEEYGRQGTQEKANLAL